VAFDGEELFHYSNKSGQSKLLEPGHIYGVSNELLDSPWPKLVLGKDMLARIIEEHLKEENPHEFSTQHYDKLYAILLDKTRFPEESLPNTGVGLEWEKVLCPIFVEHTGYGTRSSTVILWDKSNTIAYEERAGKVNEKGELVLAGPVTSNTYKFAVI